MGDIEYVTESVTGSNGQDARTTHYGYVDKKGYLETVEKLNPGEEAVTSRYEYGEYGTIRAVINPLNGKTIYTYDDLHRVKTRIIGDTKTEYTYNAEGLLASVEEADDTTEYTYDKLGRVTVKKDKLGTIYYSYDANGNIETVEEKQGIHTKTIKRTYDKMNRVKTCTYDGKTISYNYDHLGNRVSINYPGGEIVRYTYYKNGNVKTVTSSNGEVSHYDYDENGNVTSLTRGDGSKETYTYNLLGMVTSQTDVSSEGEKIHEFTYTYDAYGNMTGSTGKASPDFTMKSVSMSYQKDDNRLTVYNGQVVKYDAKGNMTYGPFNGRMAAFEYDCRNRLIKVVDEAGNKTVYEYDPEDTRVAVIQNGIRTEYVVDKNTAYSQILTETTYEQGALGIKKKTAEKDYIYGLGLICEADKETEECNYYHYNSLGSTTELTDKAGNVLYRFAYGPYGELTGIRDGNGNNLIHLTVGKNVKECLCETLGKIKLPFLYVNHNS